MCATGYVVLGGVVYILHESITINMVVRWTRPNNQTNFIVEILNIIMLKACEKCATLKGTPYSVSSIETVSAGGTASEIGRSPHLVAVTWKYKKLI